MSFILSKKNKKLLFNDKGGYESRNNSTFWCINQADLIYKWKDFDNIIINTGDKGGPQLCYVNNSNIYNKIIPDFTFHCWKEVGINDYTEETEKIDKAGLQKYKINKVGWVGNIKTNIDRKKLLEIGNKNNELFEIIPICWSKSDNIKLNCSNYLSLSDLVKNYSILIDVTGSGYSGRVKLLLFSHRPLLLVDRAYKEYFYEYLKEWEHYIPVKKDLSDLIEKTQWCIDNYNKALEIAENAYKFSKKYLTREACYEQWNKVITNL